MNGSLMMKRNVGSYEAAARFVAGCVLLVLANHGLPAGWIGVAVLASAAAERCPVWWWLGIDTARRERIVEPRAVEQGCFNRLNRREPPGRRRRIVRRISRIA